MHLPLSTITPQFLSPNYENAVVIMRVKFASLIQLGVMSLEKMLTNSNHSDDFRRNQNIVSLKKTLVDFIITGVTSRDSTSDGCHMSVVVYLRTPLGHH